MRNLIKNFSRIIAVVFIFALLLVPTASIFAIDAPISTSLISVNAYQNCIESNDMLFLVYGNIQYTTYPTDYNTNDAFLLRMFDGATELAATQLYANPYFHGGYGKFMASLYFNADDATAAGLTWGSAYTANLTGNPAISFNGTAPSASIAITWSGTGQAARVIYIMNQLQAQWGVSLVDSGTLSDYGEDYAISVIPYLRAIAPTIFESYTIQPEYHERSKNWFVYALTLKNQWVGTWMDLTTLETLTTIPQVWLYGGIWLIVMAGIIFGCIEVPAMITRQGLVSPGAKNTKMIFYLVIILIFFGGITGFLPWIASGLVGFILAIMIIYPLFFKPASG